MLASHEQLLSTQPLARQLCNGTRGPGQLRSKEADAEAQDSADPGPGAPAPAQPGWDLK